MTGMELTYAYRMASAVRCDGGGSELLLGTSGGRTESGPAAHPHLFHGFLTDPRPAALGMLACAAVAGARYYTPASVIAAILADPVVTSHGDRLRFESFSGCDAMHPRLASARALAGSVVAVPGGALVRGGEVEHRVTFASPHDVCTCPWWGRHRGTRGPCKHVLAARMAVAPMAGTS